MESLLDLFSFILFHFIQFNFVCLYIKKTSAFIGRRLGFVIYVILLSSLVLFTYILLNLTSVYGPEIGAVKACYDSFTEIEI